MGAEASSTTRAFPRVQMVLQDAGSSFLPTMTCFPAEQYAPGPCPEPPWIIAGSEYKKE